MSKKLILLVDDEIENLEVMTAILEKAGYDIETASSGVEAFSMLKKKSYDMIISDLKMPELKGDALFVRLPRLELNKNTPFILMTAFGTVESAVEMVKKGVCDYIQKPINYNQLKKKIRDILNKKNDLKKTSTDKPVEELSNKSNLLAKPIDIIGSSLSLRKTKEIALTVAGTNSTVLIEGESGTGKELFATFIHNNSLRKDGPFICVNCAALSETLLESELFGHEKGAFTGALTKRIGKFEYASQGTIFIDEISEASSQVQSKLLRVIQEREIERLGNNEPISVNVRLIVATNKNLKEYIKEHKFREDLYHRINVVPIKLPPLRDRKGDVMILAEHFLKKFSAELSKPIPILDKNVKSALNNYTWPGNVRELENLIERFVVLDKSGRITQESLPAEIAHYI